MSRCLARPLHPPAAARGWWPALGLLAALWGGLLTVYAETWQKMAAIWARSETFAHGYLVLPVALWLVWRRRRLLVAMQPQPAPAAALLLVPAGVLWLASHLAGINVGEQLALVLMLQVAVLAALGFEVTRAILFPLGFLGFMVPMGEALIPHLMDFTAHFTVQLLRLTGIPVYAEGTFFSIPGSDWSVVEGCSGIRYLIASVFLGTLYAYLNYRRLWKRLLFVALSAGVPILANGFRAYMIVMIAHLSDMRLALGVDHFIYGWVFFGIVVLLLFWIGAFWRDTEPPEPAPIASESPARSAPTRLVATGLLALVLGGVWNLWAGRIAQAQAAAASAPVPVALPDALGGWRLTKDMLSDWRPTFHGATAEASGVYVRQGVRVGVHLAYYRVQRQGAELVNSRNYLVPQKHPRWRNPGTRLVQRARPPREVVEAVLEAPDQTLLVERFYWLDGRLTARDWRAKLMEAIDRLRGRFPPAAGVTVYTEVPEEGGPARARARLDAFLDTAWPELDRVLHRAGGRP